MSENTPLINWNLSGFFNLMEEPGCQRLSSIEVGQILILMLLGMSWQWSLWLWSMRFPRINLASRALRPYLIYIVTKIKGGGQTPSSFARQKTSDTVLEILDLFPILYTCFSSQSRVPKWRVIRFLEEGLCIHLFFFQQKVTGAPHFLPLV